MLKDLIPYISYDELRKYADDFLNRYNPDDNLPIPIEEIIEFQLKLNIIPIKELKNVHDIDGWLTSDLRSIIVDEYQIEHFENRYRFTLAHEVSHLVLHKKVYKSANINTTDDYLEFIKQLEETGLVANFEWQANNLAGLILVPEYHLFQETKKISSEHIKNTTDDIIKHTEIFWDLVKWKLSKAFNVSEKTIDIRFQLDNVSNKIKLS